jgi:mono/diheme cytochrome c family protein
MPVTSTKANSCYGVATKVLGPGQSQTLTATLIEPGRYEYLSTVAGQAAAGMKGLIGVGVTLTGARAPVAPAATTTDQVGTTCNGRCAPAPVSTAPTTKPPATESLVGNPTVGAPLFVADCGSCHTLAAAHTSSSIGPNLDEIAPLQEELIDYMTYGSDSMPAFGGELTGDQLNAVAAYVYSSTHS